MRIKKHRQIVKNKSTEFSVALAIKLPESVFLPKKFSKNL